MSDDIHSQKILILDFGSQYTQLIARRVRELGVYCEIWNYEVERKAFTDFAPQGIIFSGSPESAIAGTEDAEAGQADDNAAATDAIENTAGAKTAAAVSPRPPDWIYEAGVPILGICYGMQVMAEHFGGKVESSAKSEFGYAKVNLIADSDLFKGIKDRVTRAGAPQLDVWMSHGDKVAQAPPRFTPTAASDNAPIAAISDEMRRFYGIQFHPEVTHTPQGQRLLERFVRRICGCEALWNAGSIIDDAVAGVRAQVGEGGGKVLLGLSGGVDSSVVAALLHRAIGDRLLCVFVDNGLLRLNEGDEVMTAFAARKGIKVIRVNAEDYFLNNLGGKIDPEEKRRVIGNTFIEVFEKVSMRINRLETDQIVKDFSFTVTKNGVLYVRGVAKNPNAGEISTESGIKWLAQGTIYPDVIESAGSSTGKAHVIKSHHNVGGLPAKMQLRLIEPLRELFKDEVRKIGIELGLPRYMVNRHPFPGPGLGVRVLGEVRKEYCDILRRADAIFINELWNAKLYNKVSQAFAVFLPVKSVGVVGDARRYAYIISLRAVETIDFMTARWADLPYELLETVSRRIMNEIPQVSRVTYDISGKPPATIEWE